MTLGKRQRAGYQEEEDETDDAEDTGNNGVWSRARKLLQPTSDWGPAGRNPLTPSRTLPHTPSPGKFFFSRIVDK